MDFLKSFETFNEANHTNLNEFGLENATNIRKAKKELKEKGISYSTSTGGGFTYFVFKTKKDLNAGMKAVKAVIRRTVEDSDWWTSAEEKDYLKHQAENNPK